MSTMKIPKFPWVDKNIDDVRVMVAELRSEMKSDIVTQTKWMFGGMMAAATLVTVALPPRSEVVFYLGASNPCPE